MAVSIRHNKVAATPNNPGYEIGSDAWNENHNLDTSDGSEGDIVTIVSGEAVWAAPSGGGGSPGGSSGDVQFNDGAGGFSGDAKFHWDDAFNQLTIGVEGDNGGSIVGQNATTSNENGGAIFIIGGDANGTGYGGYSVIQGGAGSTTDGSKAGSIDIKGGLVNADNADGGDIYIRPSLGEGSGANGNLIITNLPTSDPGVSGAIYYDGSGNLKISL